MGCNMTAQLWVFIWTFIASIIGPSVKKILVALGVGFVTYTGFDTAMDSLKDYVYMRLGSAPASVVQILGLLEVDKAINVIFSAIAFRAVLSGFRAGKKVTHPWSNPAEGGNLPA